MSHLERRRELHGTKLFGDSLGDLAASMAGVHTPEPGHSVDDLPAVGGPIVHAFRAREQPRIGLELPVGGERHPEGVKLGGGGKRRQLRIHGESLKRTGKSSDDK